MERGFVERRSAVGSEGLLRVVLIIRDVECGVCGENESRSLSVQMPFEGRGRRRGVAITATRTLGGSHDCHLLMELKVIGRSGRRWRGKDDPIGGDWSSAEGRKEPARQLFMERYT